MGEKGSPREAGIIHILLPVILIGGIVGAAILYNFYPNFFSDIQNPKVKAQVAQPNVVVIMTDDQPLKHSSLMPYVTSKPYGKWIEFNNFYNNYPLCCPSRATFLTGLYSHHHGVGSNTEGNQLVDTSTLATWLQGSGYATALIGKYLNDYPWGTVPNNYIPPGWSDWQVFTNNPDYKNYTLNENGTLVNYNGTDADYSTDVLKNKALNFINSATGPFFLWFTPKAPHSPYTPAARHLGAYAGQTWHTTNFNEADVSDKPLWVQNLPLLSETDIIAEEQDEKKAAESLLAVDEAVNAIIDTLNTRGILENTIIIVTSDNGYAWGSHRWDKKSCAYEECVRIPLMVRYPEATDNRTETRLVSNIDLAPTIAALTGITPPLMDGISLTPLLNNTPPPSWRSAVLLRGKDAVMSFWGVKTDSWKYAELATGEKELYDLVNDPFELNNVAGDSQYATIQADLAAQLVALKASNPGSSPSPSPSGDTTAPSVSITSPKNNAFVKGKPAIKATATGNIKVTKVEFYIDGVLSATKTSTTSTFSYPWDTKLVSNGTHTITAKAYDAAGNTTTSDPITVTVDNILPTVSITSPTDGAIVSGTTLISANASDNTAVKEVKFLINGVIKKTDKIVPYDYSWNTTNLTNGIYTITAKVFDLAGNTATSSPITVTVQN